MKFAVLLAIALTVVACNKEQPAPAAEVGHDKEHQHVEAAPDHAHDEAHHPEHGTEQAPQQ